MRILLDTHIFLWSINNDKKLSDETKDIILTATDVYVSSATIWECAIKIRLGKLQANIKELIAAIHQSGFSDLPVNANQASLLATLPDIHRDPFDRILVCQAMIEPLKLITADSILKQYTELAYIV